MSDLLFYPECTLILYYAVMLWKCGLYHCYPHLWFPTPQCYILLYYSLEITRILFSLLLISKNKSLMAFLVHVFALILSLSAMIENVWHARVWVLRIVDFLTYYRDSNGLSIGWTNENTL